MSDELTPRPATTRDEVIAEFERLEAAGIGPGIPLDELRQLPDAEVLQLFADYVKGYEAGLAES